MSAVGAADAELGQHERGRLGAVILAMQRAAMLDLRHAHLPRPVGEHHDMGAELGGRVDRILARGHGVDAAVERVLRPRPDLDARLLVILAVAFHEAGLERVDDHGRGLVEAAARFVHAQPEGRELAPRQAASEAQPQPALAQHVEHGGVLGDAQRIVPGQDHRRRADVDVRAERGEMRHQREVVGHERVVVEVMLGRPQAIEAQVGGEPRQPDLLVPHAIVGAVLPAVAGEHHHHADIHEASSIRCLIAAMGNAFTGRRRRKPGPFAQPQGDAADVSSSSLGRLSRA